MGKILEPNIKVPDIVIEADENSEYSVDRILNNWGSSIPIIQIGDYVLKIVETISCHINIKINSIPSFDIVVVDTNYKIREALKKELDKCIIFFGFRDWYVKFNGLITEVQSGSGESKIFMKGIFYQEPLYLNKQKLWKDTSVIDIIKDICTETKLGLFTFDNNDLNYTPDIVINPNTSNIEFTKELLARYTNNIWCYDTFGYLHIGDIETIFKQPIDKYTISYENGEQIQPKDIVFRTRKLADADKDTDKIYVDYYTVNTNFSLSHLLTSTKYDVFFDDESTSELKTDENIGYGDKSDNSFVGFSKHKFPFYTERVNKLLCGNLIKLKLRNVMYEIVPFTVVNLELNLPSTTDLGITSGTRLDEEHSGKHIVIGYSYDYDKKNNSEQNNITQSLYLL